MSLADEKKDDSLALQGVIGFNGDVSAGLILHPDDERLIYPLGSTVVVKYLTKNIQHFLQKDGHDNTVSCLSLSSSGKLLASGQSAPMGFLAEVIIWDLERYEVVHKLKLHKGKVQSVAFSPTETYMASLGGRDDNKLVIWDVNTGEPLCGSSASNDVSNVVQYLGGTDTALVTAGSYSLRVWDFDRANRKVRPTDMNLGQLKRVIQCLAVDEEEGYAYCGTTTGDMLKVSLGPKVIKTLGPAKKPFSLGISAVCRTKKGNLIVGTGDGVVAVLDKETLSVVKQTKLPGHVTSLQLNKAGDHFFVATKECTIHLVHLASFENELRNTCHYARINDVAFPAGYSDLFATCSKNDIRVWHSKNCSELLRIRVPNLECLCVAFSYDGKSILSGWDDGKIRAFTPQTGKLMYVLHDAHTGGVTAITSTKNSQAILSGGRDGQVRVWAISAQTQRMVASMKEHKGPINQIVLNNEDTECISASDDGSCIVWSLERYVRANCLFATTQFKSALYHPDQSQILTTGTDRKITYWDGVDGQPIRILDGSATAELNTLSISADGEHFVAAGSDKLVKIYGYDEGVCHFRGVGHSGSITKVVISPDQNTIVSCGAEGAIFIWSNPYAAETNPPPVEPVPAESFAAVPTKSASSKPSAVTRTASLKPSLKTGSLSKQQASEVAAKIKSSLAVH